VLSAQQIVTMDSLGHGLHQRSDGSGSLIIPIHPAAALTNRALVAVLFTCAALSWTLFILRIWTRAKLVGSVGYDDFALFIALVSNSSGFLHCTNQCLPGKCADTLLCLLRRAAVHMFSAWHERRSDWENDDRHHRCEFKLEHSVKTSDFDARSF
jgi:hypothetical protein